MESIFSAGAPGEVIDLFIFDRNIEVVEGRALYPSIKVKAEYIYWIPIFSAGASGEVIDLIIYDLSIELVERKRFNLLYRRYILYLTYYYI